MTREEIMRLEGRELDAAVHQHIFGRRVKRATKMVSINGGEWLPLRRVPADPDTGSEVPHYSTDIAEAWQVVERMRERGLYFELAVSSSEEYAVAGFWSKDNGWQAKGRRAPESICRAALLAVRGEENSDADA